MILGIACMVLANAATVLGAHVLAVRFRTGEGPVDLLLLLTIRLLCISTIVIVAGLTRTLSPALLGIAGALTVLIICLKGGHRSLFTPRPWNPGWLLGSIAIALLLRTLAQVWFFAPHTTDVLSYHLPKIAEWVRAGAFVREMGPDNHSTFPAGFELIETWWVVFLHHDVLIELAGVEFLLLLFSAVVALAGKLGLSAKSSFLAGIVTSLSPGLMLQSTSCMNDGPVAALLVTSFAVIACRLPLPLILLPVGLGMGVKPTFVYALPGLTLTWLLLRKEAMTIRPDKRFAWALAAAALTTGAFWYGRNLAWFGNPVYPLGAQNLPIQFGPRVSSLLENLNSLATVRLYDRGSYGAHLDGIAGWGTLAFGAGILGAFHWCAGDATFRRLAAGFLLGLASVLLMVRGDDWFARFCLFFPALLAIAAVRFVEAYRLLTPCLVLGLLFQILATMLPYDLPLRDFAAMARQSWRDRSASELFEIPADRSQVGYFTSNRGPAYCLYRPDFSSPVVYLRASTPRMLIEQMRLARVSTIFLGDLEHREELLVQSCLREGLLRRTGPKTLAMQ